MAWKNELPWVTLNRQWYVFWPKEQNDTKGYRIELRRRNNMLVLEMVKLLRNPYSHFSTCGKLMAVQMDIVILPKVGELRKKRGARQNCFDTKFVDQHTITRQLSPTTLTLCLFHLNWSTLFDHNWLYRGVLF